MDLYTVGGRRWTYTCRYCLEPSLLYRYFTHYRCESYSLLVLESLLGSLLDCLLDSLLERAAFERATLREE
jgi:hypothetical protein